MPFQTVWAKRTLTASGLLALWVCVGAGCLKTRAQIRETDSGAPSPLQEVPTQGGYVIDEIKSEITRLNGRLEDVERTQKQGAAADKVPSKEDVKKLEGRIQELEQAQTQLIEALKRLEARPTALNPEDLWEKTVAKYEEKSYDAAIEGFTAYLGISKAPHPDEALFLRGESFFQTKQFKKAIVDYSKLTEKHGKSKRVPIALYRTGLCFDAMEMKEEAKAFYQDLVDKFPKDSWAKQAKKKLKSAR